MGAERCIRDGYSTLLSRPSPKTRGQASGSPSATALFPTIREKSASRTPGTAPWLPGEYRLRSLWRRAFDRPTTWRVTELLPDPRQFLQSGQRWRAGLESCRLTLALRMFKETHSHWPDKLWELSPGILEAVPLDPLTGGAFEYVREGDGWRLAAGGPRSPRSAQVGLTFRHEPKSSGPAGREKAQASQGR